MTTLLLHALAVAGALVAGTGCSDAPAAPDPRRSEQPVAAHAQPRGRSGGPPRPMRAARRGSLHASSREVLRAGLTSTDYATRLTATEALGYMPGPTSLQLLEHQLGDAEADVRAAAILALGRHRGPRAKALLQSVRDDEQEELALRVLAVRSLASPPTPCRERK